MLKRFDASLQKILVSPAGEYCSVCDYPKERRVVCVHCLDLAQARRYEKKKTQEQTLALVERLGGWRPYEEYLVTRFRPSTVTQPALDACLRWDYHHSNLYFWSAGSGTGKSHLATIAARRYIEAGVDGRVVKPNELFREVRATYDDDATESDGDVIGRIVRLPILVLDDLGTQKDTEWNLTCLYEFIEGRNSHRPGGLIVTANLSLEQAEKRWGSRIGSRLHQLCGKLVFDFSGERDHRRAE